jgi:hypothetical protein
LADDEPKLKVDPVMPPTLSLINIEASPYG